jgi:hypothetical protein
MDQKGHFTTRMEERIKARQTEDLTVAHTCDAAYIYHPVGASLDEIEPFTMELTQVVDTMKEELANEKRILEGTDVPEYKENELTIVKITEEQWKNALQSGSLTTDPIHTSTPVSDSLFGSAEPLNLDSLDAALPDSSEILFRRSCWARSEDCGTETDAMNECSECTVPTTSEPTDGTPSEAK